MLLLRSIVWYAVVDAFGPSFKTALRRPFHVSTIKMMPEGPEVLNLVNYLHSKCTGAQIIAVKILSGRYQKKLPIGWQILQDKLAEKQQPILLKRIQSKGKFIWFDCETFYVFSTLGLSGMSPPLSLLFVTLCFTLVCTAHPITYINLKVNLPVVFFLSYSHHHVCLRLIVVYFLLVVLTHITLFQRFLGDWTVLDGDNHATLDNYARVSFSLIVKQNNTKSLVFSDMIGYGTLKVTTKEELDTKLKSLGPCWLTNRPTFDQFEQIITKEKGTRPLVKTLMDQKRFSGVGNYILSEALYRARIHPFAVCGSLVEETGALRSLYDQIVIVISSSYNSQHLYRNIPASTSKGVGEENIWTSTEAASTSFSFLVYRQKKCPETSLPVVKETGLHGRAIHWVPSVQTLCSPS